MRMYMILCDFQISSYARVVSQLKTTLYWMPYFRICVTLYVCKIQFSLIYIEPNDSYV